MKQLKFTLTKYGNEVITTDEFHISFRAAILNSSLDQLGILFGFENNIGKPETAVNMNGVWYILNGDFRKEFEEAANKGPLAVLETIGTLSKYKSDWSTIQE